MSIWNGEYGLKLSGYFSALDFSLYGFYGWDDKPVLDYEMTYSDRKQVEKINKIVEALYKKHGKDEYKTKLISLFRWLASKDSISDSKKAIYNKVLINLFTIWDL